MRPYTHTLEFSRRIRAAREAAGLTHEEVAKRVGCSAKRVRRCETSTSGGNVHRQKVLDAALAGPNLPPPPAKKLPF